MAALRDELAKRQGAMTAVEDANKLRADAEKVRADAEVESQKMLDYAKVTAKEADVRHAELNKRESALAGKVADFDADYNKRTSQLDARLKDIQKQEKSLQERESRLLASLEEMGKDKAKLAADRENLDQRIKAFQEKVAALKV